jgi:hypothetical protein
MSIQPVKDINAVAYFNTPCTTSSSDRRALLVRNACVLRGDAAGGPLPYRTTSYDAHSLSAPGDRRHRANNCPLNPRRPRSSDGRRDRANGTVHGVTFEVTPPTAETDTRAMPVSGYLMAR